MGKTIVSWSPIHGQGATTSNTVSLASVFSLEHKRRSLLTHTQLSYSSMESLFGKKRIGEGFEQTGISALERLMKSQLLKSDAVIDYTETIYQDRLDMLGGSSKGAETGLLEAVLHVTKDIYDSVWIDAHSGLRTPTTLAVLKSADLVLVNLPQNRFVLDEFFSGDGIPEVLKNKPYIILISEYDADLELSIRKIKRQYNVKKDIFPILYSERFKNASNNEVLSEFFFRQIGLGKKSPAYNFIQSIQAATSHIARELEFIESNKEDIE
ncbi:hypothetical protein [Viridibacillus arvi]|uniref:hypothetical protein n=1 Tax=Viridibacillus arvi TaxID=263475 RepID=UPI0034CF04FC